MSETYKITNIVPIPIKVRKYKHQLYPFSKMRKGDSFYVPNRVPDALYNASYRFRVFKGNEKYKNWRFTVKKEGNGTRIWRTQ